MKPSENVAEALLKMVNPLALYPYPLADSLGESRGDCFVYLYLAGAF